MINLNESYINSIAPNEAAVKNALGIVRKKNFVKLYKSKDETLLFGDCMGSSDSNYKCSVDFIRPENPVFRCTCPSRQIPCKHTLGLMFAYISGNKFENEEIPKDIREKREKADKKEAKKNEGPSEKAPRKINKAALAKKIKTQIEGLSLLQKIAEDIVKNGFAAIDNKTLDNLGEQAEFLGGSYLTGGERELREFMLLFKNNENREKIYIEAQNQITTIYSLCKKGRDYLEKRLQDPELSMDTSTSIDEWLGYSWQLEDLERAGLFKDDAELIQLSFDCYMDRAACEYVDTGLWIELGSGEIHKTCNYRPFRAAKYIKEDDSFFLKAEVKRLYKYPGDINRRVRWEELITGEIDSNDYERIKALAKSSYIEVIKAVKNQIKNPLADKNPVMLLKYRNLGTADEDYIIEDDYGKRIRLVDITGNGCKSGMLNLLKSDELANQAMLVRFEHDFNTGRLFAKPLSIITEKEIIRLCY
jgi:hypothetical protein